MDMKIEKLFGKKEREVKYENCYTKIGNVELSEEECKLLSLGPKFAPLPLFTEQSKINLIANIQKAANLLK